MNTVELIWKFSSINIKESWVHPCSLIIDHFGLPGSKYHTEITDRSMLFHFNNLNDALMCKLLVSEFQ